MTEKTPDQVNREHIRQRSREWAAKNREKVRQYSKNYRTNHPENFARSHAKHQKANLEKFRAKVYAERYAKLGEKCEVCSTTERLERHHPDYSKPLEIMTLCHRCHRGIHAKIKQGKVDQASLQNRHCLSCSKSFPKCGKKHPSIKGRNCALWETTNSQQENP